MPKCAWCGQQIEGSTAELEAHIHENHPDRSQGAAERNSHHPIRAVTRPARPKPDSSPWKLGGLSFKELGKRVWNSMNEDDVLGRAAQLAYYFFLALFPALMFAISILGIMAGPGSQMRTSLMHYMAQALPPDAYNLIQKTLDEITKASGGGKITFGILAGLFSASSGMAAVQDTLNAVYKVPEGRPLWKARAIAIGLTVAGVALAVVALTIILYGNTLANFVGAHLGLGPVLTLTWKIVQWPVALFFLAMVFAITYYWAPDVEQRHWEWITPGAVLGMGIWILASVIFRVYLHYFNSYSATYGSLGAVMILLTWFYATGVAILIGGEVNARIEDAAAKRGQPEAKMAGEKVPGEKSSRPAA